MSRRASVLALLSAACADPAAPPVFVHATAGLGVGVDLAVKDLEAELGRMGTTVTRELGAMGPCRAGEIHLTIDPAALDDPEDFAIEDERCEDGRALTLSGGSDMARQWAVYAVLEATGVRFFHPERTYRPARPGWPEASLSGRRHPRFRRRSMNVHRTHPVELSAPKEPGDLDMAGYQRRWVDWSVKMRQTLASGWDGRFLGTYPHERGFPRTTGMNLLNTQQGGRPVIDPDDPRPEEEQLAAAIDERMAPVEGLPAPIEFGFQFNPSEFTEVDDRETVNRLTFISNHLSARHPGVLQSTINHGTAGRPTAHYGVRFFDLPEFAPPALGVSVHTLMFYDVSERAAPVYGNESFHHLFRWIERQSQVRRIVHYPESSWWLTFDLPVPLYLAPVTLEARQKDLDLLAPLIDDTRDGTKGVRGHHLFTSGQEWGYWLIDYCVAKMAYEPIGHQACVDDFLAIFADPAPYREVWRAVEARQVVDLRDPELLAMLVGSDDETEVAFKAGIVFHPLPPPPAEVVGYDDAAAARLAATLERVAELGADYRRNVDRLRPIAAREAEDVAEWAREIVDGLEAFALRAEHAVEIYRTALALRAALRAGDLAGLRTAHDGVDRARAITAAAKEVIHRRERDYRYPPALTIAGDEPGTPGAIPNDTIYPYRYLSRTHRAFYYTRPDDQLAALFGEGLELVQVDRRILGLGRPLAVRVLAEGQSGLAVDYGDGTRSSTLTPHTYAATGLYDWVLDVQHAGGVLHHEDRAAVVDRRFVFGKGSPRVKFPEGAQIIEGFLPGFEIGWNPNEWVMGRIDDGATSARGSLSVHARAGAEVSLIELPIELPGIGLVRIAGARLAIAEPATLRIEGKLRTAEIVELLVGVGGFEPVGARRIVAMTLGYTEDSLPAEMPFVVEADGREEP